MNWLKLFARQPEHHHIKLSITGPLYAASAVFERRIRRDYWAVEAAVEASLPLRKKWSASAKAEGTFGGESGFSTHEEATSSRPSDILWTTKPGALELRIGSETLVYSRAQAEAPFVSSADVFFVIQDCWNPNDGPRLFFAVAGRKVFAIRIEPRGKEIILGRLVQLASPSGFKNGATAFEEAFESGGYDFELGWDDRTRRLTEFSVRAPIVGKIKADFN